MTAQSATGHPATTAETRLGGFDIVRVLAAVGVVALHGTAPYLAHPLPGLDWSVSDSPSHIADYIGWPIELFIMPLFLMIAGFFTPAVLDRLSTWDFIKHRFQRLIIPLAVAMVLILPADLYIWLTGWLIEERIPARKIQSLKFENGIDANLWGLSHLWFLQYLFMYTVVYALAARAAWIERAVKWLTPVVALLGLAVGAWLILFWVPQVVFGFQHDFLPVPSKWLYSGTYFAAGLIIAKQEHLQQFLRTHWRWWLAVGIAASFLGVNFGCRMLDAESALEKDFLNRALATIFTVIAAWTISGGAVGWAMATRWPTTYPLRYLAAASFWVYLIHHPIIGLSHIQLKVLAPALPSEIKIVVSIATALLFSLLSFEVFVRRWPLANLLATPREFVKLSDSSLLAAEKQQSGGLEKCQGVAAIGCSLAR